MGGHKSSGKGGSSGTGGSGGKAFVLRLSGGREIVLGQGAQLRAADFPSSEIAGSGGVVAEVACHPKDPSLLGLKNLSRQPWTAVVPNGERRNVEMGRSIALHSG